MSLTLPWAVFDIALYSAADSRVCLHLASRAVSFSHEVALLGHSGEVRDGATDMTYCSMVIGRMRFS